MFDTAKTDHLCSNTDSVACRLISCPNTRWLSRSRDRERTRAMWELQGNDGRRRDDIAVEQQRQPIRNLVDEKRIIGASEMHQWTHVPHRAGACGVRYISPGSELLH